jgi:hypothetical protein
MKIRVGLSTPSVMSVCLSVYLSLKGLKVEGLEGEGPTMLCNKKLQLLNKRFNHRECMVQNVFANFCWALPDHLHSEGL